MVAPPRRRQQRQVIEPRLLTPKQAALYLGCTDARVLSTIPVKPIALGNGGPGRGKRYDRKALDQWIDRFSEPTHGTQADADAELEAWRRRRSERR